MVLNSFERSFYYAFKIMSVQIRSDKIYILIYLIGPLAPCKTGAQENQLPGTPGNSYYSRFGQHLAALQNFRCLSQF